MHFFLYFYAHILSWQLQDIHETWWYIQNSKLDLGLPLAKVGVIYGTLDRIVLYTCWYGSERDDLYIYVDVIQALQKWTLVQNVLQVFSQNILPNF